jgi:dipeptidyl aminopeptidase/acylaminoacyl peptidase
MSVPGGRLFGASSRSRRDHGAPRSVLIILVLAVWIVVRATPASPQDKPVLTVEDDCTAFSFGPDGRIAYAVRHLMHTKHYDLQRDDIWVVTAEGKKTRIVNGEKLVRGGGLFSYSVQSIAWSPDGRFLAVAMYTTQVVDEKENTKDEQIVDLMDVDGKEINIQGTHNSVIDEALNATWLADGATVAFLAEAVKPKLLYSIGTVRPVGGRGGLILAGHTFTAVAWDAKRNAAVAIERDRSLTGPILLVRLDLIKETRRELATLDAYLGQLSISPSGDRVAYFRDGGTLEFRALASPEKATQVSAAYGRFEWGRDERRILLKRGPENKSGSLAWVSLPDGALESALHDLAFRHFQISPDGRRLGVTEPGKQALQVYSLP